MKTKWKKIKWAPWFCLALSMVWINHAKAGVWETTQTKICSIQVQVDTGGGYEWGTVQGVRDVCEPQPWSFCSAKRCVPLVHGGIE